MKMKKLFYIMIIVALLLLSGCGSKQETGRNFDIPEAEKIQQMLDDMSQAVIENDEDAISGSISEGCPGLRPELDNLKKLAGSSLSSYSQTALSARRLKDGVVCTVNISWEGTYDSKSVKGSNMRNMYFIYENSAWKIGDFNYHPYVNPAIIVGSESELYDAAYGMSEAFNSRLQTDTEHLQSYGDIIMVGTPYDNASILDLEEKELTAVRVTEDYPGGGLGIVQVLSNVESYRHVIIIQGSEAKTAKSSIEYMTQYIKENPYLNPGVYFIEENRLRMADALELTTLVTLDIAKSSVRIREVQKQVEANIRIMEEEFLAEKERLNREQIYLNNKYREDYPRVFSRYEFYPERSLYDSMVLINAAYTDERLCTDAFRLAYGNNAGTAYAYADYMLNNIKLSDKESQDDKGPLLGEDISHTLAAHEIVSSANELELSALSTAMLRLSGFSSNEVFAATTAEGNSIFLNIDSGYTFSPGSPAVSDPELQVPAGRLASLYNDGAFISYADNTSNLDAEEVSSLQGKVGSLFRLSGSSRGKVPEKISFGESELSESPGMPNDAEEIYTLLRNSYIAEDSPCRFSTLDEAREQLRTSMGRLLALKCTRYLVNTAARYPASQFDLARYAAGLINVEHPEAYAEASESSLTVKQLSGGISNLLSDASDKTDKLMEILDGIAEEENTSEIFLFPDYCTAQKQGSHRDKALLAFGLYGRLTGNSEDAYIALGENSSYLVFAQEGQWKYLDCKYDTLRDFIEDEIYVVFNKSFVYNKNLEIGYLPDFLE